jgi:hypothetical protein
MPKKISTSANIMVCGKLALPISDKAIKSKFFYLVRSERNPYFLGSANPLQFQKIPFIDDVY